MLAYHAIYFSRSRASDRKTWAKAGILVDVVAVMLVLGAFGAVEDEISDVSSEVPVSGGSGIGVMIAGFVIVIIGSIVASAASNTPRPNPVRQVSPGPPPPPTVTVLLRELDMLRQHGKVTDEEYAARRKRILES
jgi:Co/Zn/Cd efflux system component